MRSRPAALHDLNSSYWFECPYEHAAGLSRGLRHQVEALVHPVDEVHISMPRRPEDDLRASGDAARRVRSQVVAAQVRFRLDDSPGSFAVYQKLAQQVARDFHGRAAVERARQNHLTIWAAAISSLAPARRLGQRKPNTAAASMHTMPPPATVAGAPQRPAATPAISAPIGAMPMNIIE